MKRLENAIVRNGTKYSLNCSATGAPKPRYSWTKDDDAVIPNAASVQKKRLIINPVSSKNQGRYTCTAENVEGKVRASAKITVYGKIIFIVLTFCSKIVSLFKLHNAIIGASVNTIIQ